jgi:predicted O-methyltransferase YrrM
MKIGAAKTLRLMSLIVKKPAEFRDRASMIVESCAALVATKKPIYTVSPWEAVLRNLSVALNSDLNGFLNELGLHEATSRLRQRVASLPPEAPFGAFHNGDLALAKLCYAVTRALEPTCVLETGVCYGVTSSFILAALEHNHKGSLHSIDLPPLGRDADRFVGWMIMDGPLKARWHLHRALSRRALPTILDQVEPLSLFVHDSLHTYENMCSEFDLVWPRLRPGGIFISDDIEGNSAFQEWSSREDVAFHVAIRELEKESLFGILVKSPQR